jgi:hypothetical protein
VHRCVTYNVRPFRDPPATCRDLTCRCHQYAAGTQDRERPELPRSARTAYASAAQSPVSAALTTMYRSSSMVRPQYTSSLIGMSSADERTALRAQAHYGRVGLTEPGVEPPSKHAHRRPPDSPQTPRHRREGKAQVSVPPETFAREFWGSPWDLLQVGVGGLLAVTWGGSTFFTGDSMWHRAMGLLGVVAGVLAWVSYFLHFRPDLLAAERWTATPPRRAAKIVFVNAWWAFIVAALMAWLVTSLVD